MAGKLTNLETRLDDLFVRSAPKIPESGRKAFVNWLPIISLVIGALALLSAWNLWHRAHVVSNVIDDSCNAYSVSGCGTSTTTSHLSVWLWLSVIFVGIEGLVYLLAYPGLQARKKEGWSYLFYGLLINIVYAVASLFTGYNSAANFLGALLGSAIGLYLLFQVRGAYASKKTTAATAPKGSEKK